MDNNNNYQHVLYQQQRFYNYALSPSTTTQHSSVNYMYPYTPTPSSLQQQVPGSIQTQQQQQQLVTPVPQQQQQQQQQPPFFNDQRPTLLQSDIYNKQLTNTHYHQPYIQPPQYQNHQQQQLPYQQQQQQQQQQQALFHKTLPMQNQNDKFLVDSNSLQHFQQLVQQNMYISLNQQQQQQQSLQQHHQQQQPFSQQHHQPTNIHIPYQLGCHDSFYNQNTNNNNNSNNFMLNLLPNIDLQTRMQLDSSHKITRLKEIALAAAGIQYSDATYCASKLSTSPINVQIQNNTNFNSSINNNNNTITNNLINTNNSINNAISSNSVINNNNNNTNQNYQLSIDYKATSSYEMKCQDSMYNPGSVDSTISTSSQSSICDLTNSPFSDQVYEYAAGAGILSDKETTTTTIHHHEHNQLTTTTTTKSDEMKSLDFLIEWIDTDDTHLSEFELHMREIIKQQSALNLYISNNPAATTTTKTNHQSTTTTTTTTTTTSTSTNTTTDANNNTIYK